MMASEMAETGCARADAIRAARAGGTMMSGCDDLDVHLATCGACRALAQTIHPSDGQATSTGAAFPVVDPNIYELGPVIAAGGMGQIRLVRDLRVGRIVAMKELLKKTPQLAVRFVREARVAARLQHPNIIPIYDVGCWADGTPFYTMRLLNGRTLHEAFAKVLDSEGAMQLLPSMIAAVDAVAFAHASGIVHRDLTPANILIGDFGETVVIDWGLAKDLRLQEPHRIARRFRTGATEQLLTLPGQVIGSPAYMPLEQAKGLPIDERADVYALGAVLYHLFTGRPPYVGMTSKIIIEAVRAGAAASLTSLGLAPAELARIIDKAMARDASDRYANAGELAAALRQFQAAGLSVQRRRDSTVARWFRSFNSRSSGGAPVSRAGYTRAH